VQGLCKAKVGSSILSPGTNIKGMGLMFSVGSRVKLIDNFDQKKFTASDEEWASNPKTGTVIEPNEEIWPGQVLVEFDVEWEYNLKDLMCWLQPYEIMNPEELELIPSDT
jgi:hypothetical protein